MAKISNKNPIKEKRSFSTKSPKNLREILKQNSECESKFLEAEQLALSLHNEKAYIPLPYFTRHGIDHCKKLEEFANSIIWRSEQFADNDFQPSPEESMYLLSAIWLHDIGMMYQIFDEEKPEDLSDEIYSDQIREEHEQRTVKYIHRKWRFNCSWGENQRVLLGNICYFHRKKYPITEFDPIIEKSSYGFNDIRLAVLASILRLVDGCHVDQTRAPLALLGLYRSVGMSVSHALHWERAQLITDIEFDHENREIVIIANCPKPFKFFGGIFDLKKVVKIIQKDMSKELESVQSILLPWSNLFFLNITIQTRILKSLEYIFRDQYFALWPYLLQDPRSSTEASAAFVQIALFAIDVKGINWIKEIKDIIIEMKKLRSLDFMLINLCKNIEAIIGSAAKDEQKRAELYEYLKKFQTTMEENCEKIIPYAFELISPEDVLFVFGYSLNIERILRDISTKIKVIVIDCFEPVANGFLDSENNRVLSIIKDSGISPEDIQFIQLYSFPHILSNMGRHNNKVTLLLGTHGVLNNNELLCKVGSELLARTAIDYGAQVVAFAEKSKFLNPDISSEEQETINDCIAAEDIKWHPELKIRCVEPKMDIVPHDLINVLITEEGNIFLADRHRAKPKRSRVIELA